MVKNKFKSRRTLLLILIYIILHLSASGGFYICTATVRYVSHEGSNTPPYTSWATAADSIMSAVNISVFGDTIYVANGVYKEQVIMIPGLSLIGAGMDSCVIDTREFTLTSPFYSVRVTDSCYFAWFQIITYDEQHGFGIRVAGANGLVEFNKIRIAKLGIDLFTGGFNVVRNNIITEINDGIECFFTNSIVSENLIYPKEDGLVSQINSAPTYINNIVVLNDAANISAGFEDALDFHSHLRNNLFVSVDNSGRYGMDSYEDTLINNIVIGEWGNGIFTAGSDIRNNHIEKTQLGLYYDVGSGLPVPDFQYNNLWQNQTDYQNFSADTTNIYSDPMFVDEDSMDFHLQMYSPLIDAGDPNILDVDGSRSDIGLWGGPYGSKYTYRDLAPKPPSNLSAEYDSGLVKLTWNRNTEADFYRYRVYRDTVPNFIYDTTKIIAEVADTFYYDDLPEKYIAGSYYYKLTAIDSAYHQSAASEEVKVIITGAPEGPPIIAERYNLLNNYPNPFNPSTIIPYRLIEPGYVKLYVYDIKGELVRILVNEYQTAGYYEVEFRPNNSERDKGKLGIDWSTGYNDDVASGIYIYQIIVKSDRNIPVFTDMKKMILLK
jgi:hypothetical protein